MHDIKELKRAVETGDAVAIALSTKQKSIEIGRRLFLCSEQKSGRNR